MLTANTTDPVDPVRDPWRDSMRLALQEAARAVPAGDVPVGAVVLGPAGELLATGYNEREASGDPTAHAEVLACAGLPPHSGNGGFRDAPSWSPWSRA